MPRWLPCLHALVVLVAPALGQLPPDKALAALKPADGLQVELFAAEPMLLNPTSIDVDHLGRVWVCEAVNYRNLLKKVPIIRPEGDRIVVLTDKNGDGKADDSTVFYQGKDLYGPLGIAVAKDAAGPGWQVYVCQSPDVLLFTDKDGDGKADGPPHKFLSGIKGFDHDHGVHGINIGPDGKLYFTIGDAGVDGLQSSDGKGRKWKTNDTDCRAGTVWRCDRDGKNLELIAHNFRNNYECCVNSFGEIWLSDNDDDGNQQTRLCFVMPGGDYGYYPRGPGQSHWHEEQPGIVHKVLRTGFGSPTGICFYEGSLLPEKYRGQLLHTDAGPRELRCFHIAPKGAGYELTQENLLTSTDNFFRPSDVCVAPDGSLFVSDWYDAGVGGHNMRDPGDGRIYRVTPKGHAGYKVPAVTLDTKEGVREALASPCITTRTVAHLRVLDMGWSEDMFWTIGPPYFDDVMTERKTKGTPINETLAARMSWLLSRFVDNNNPKSDRYYGISTMVMRLDGPGRAMYYRVWADLVRRGYTPNDKAAWLPIDELLDGWPDNKFAPLVRGAIWPALRESLCGAERINPDLSGERFATYAKHYDGKDIFYRAALNIACGTDSARRDAILADFDTHFPDWNDTVADLVWELRPKSVLAKLPARLADPKLSAAQKARVVDILATDPAPAAGRALLGLLGSDAPAEVQARALDNLRLFLPTKWNELTKGDDLKNAVDKLLADPKTTATGVRLVAAAGLTAAADAVAKVAADDKVLPETRAEAVRALGRVKGGKPVDALIKLATPENPLSAACAEALGQHLPARPRENPAGDKALAALERMLTGEASPALKRAALAALAGTRTGTDLLLAKKEKNELPADLVADAGTLLRNSPFQSQRNKALILFPLANKLDLKALPSPAVLAQRPGDADRGKAVMAKTATNEVQCLKCHVVNAIGGAIGPDLSSVGIKGSKENLFESILQPSKAIADQYLTWTIDTADGQTITGLVVAESELAVTVRDANGKDYPIPVKDIDKRKKGALSLMPDNLAAGLTEQELADLVAYLATLKAPPPPGK